MKHIVFLLVSGLALGAQADTLYKCQGPDGRTTYTNQKSGKNCEIISQDKPVSTFSAPPSQKPKQATPAEFPRVNGNEQKARDNDRRAILEKELASEQKSLVATRQELTDQENLVLPEERVVGGGFNAGKRAERIERYREQVKQHERNVESIRKELANLK